MMLKLEIDEHFWVEADFYAGLKLTFLWLLCVGLFTVSYWAFVRHKSEKSNADVSDFILLILLL